MAEPDYSEQVDLAALAESKGCELVKADDETLLLDLDDRKAVATMERNVEILRRRFKSLAVERYKSNGGNTHAIVRLGEPVKDPVERLLLQATLGSDPVKELLSLGRLQRGHATPCVLFRPKVAASGR